MQNYQSNDHLSFTILTKVSYKQFITIVTTINKKLLDTRYGGYVMEQDNCFLSKILRTLHIKN